MKKLNETNAMVEGLKEDLTKLEPVLEQASKDAEKLLKQVEVDKADAAKVKAKVRHEYLSYSDRRLLCSDLWEYSTDRLCESS